MSLEILQNRYKSIFQIGHMLKLTEFIESFFKLFVIFFVILFTF